MISNRNIIIFGDDWGRFPSSIQHIGKVLAKKNRILWIGSLGLRKPKFQYKDIQRAAQKFLNIFKKNLPASLEKKTIIEVHPFILPFHDSPIIRKFNNLLLLRSLKNKIKELNFINSILITSSPIVCNMVGKLGENSAYYFCLDDYSLFSGAFNSLISMEKKLLEKVDASFSVSDILQRSRVPKNGNSFFLPQGVEVEHFNSKIESIPIEIKNLKKPIIGFFGLLAPWINIELICQAALKYPQFTFLIIGKSSTDISDFYKISNIKYLGEIPYSDLPSYAKYFDVGLIPFKINELTIAANPIKLLEYLSLGIPVVSTKLPEILRFKDFVFVAENNEQFLQLIEVASNNNNPERNKLRMKEAEKYSWCSITEYISEKIMEIEKIILSEGRIV